MTSKRLDSIAGSVCLLIISMTSLTVGASLAKQLFAVAGAGGTTLVRIGMGALILGLFWRPWRTKITRAQGRSIALYGACLGIMNLLFYLAISRLAIGLAIAIEFLGPLSVALFYSKRKFDFLWALLAGLGVYLILPISGLDSSVNWDGIGYALGAAACWAFYIVHGKKASHVAPPGIVTSLGLFIGFLTIIPFGWAKAGQLFTSPKSIATACAVGFLSSALPYSLEMRALKTLPSKYFGLLMSLEPAIGAAAAFFVLGEQLTLLQGLAVIFIVAASVGSSLSISQTPLN